MKDLKHEVLMYLIRVSVYISPYLSITPSTFIAKYIAGESLKNVKKALKELMADGLVRYGHEGGWDDYNYRPFCVWGYSITGKAMELPEYKQAEEENERYWQELLERNDL